MAKKSKKFDDDIEIEEPDAEEEVTVTGHDLKAEKTKPEAKAEPIPTEAPTVPVVPVQNEAGPAGVPPPGMPGSPFGDTSQRYEGEADPAQIIKARNIQRSYEQAGLAPPPFGQPAIPIINSIDPTSAEIGGSDVLLTVTGLYFSPGSAIIFNGGIEPTTLNSDMEATTIVKPSLASIEITVPVMIRTAGGEESNAVDFSFTEPPVSRSKKSKSKWDDDE